MSTEQPDPPPSGVKAETDPSLYVGVVLGSYRLKELIGQGGMGQVYLAEHIKLGRKVAIKMLRPEYSANPALIRRFFAEAQSVNQICHENIVEVHDFVENEAGKTYLVMELLKGTDLGGVLASLPAGELLPRARALRIAVQVAGALKAVHSAGIIHRDLKPENIYLIERGGNRDFVKILDFGIAKLQDTEKVDPSRPRTAVGFVMGTPDYMPPEQAQGKEVDFRADLYAFGCILYELVTGRKPFRAEEVRELIMKHLLEQPTPPSKLKDLPRAVSRPLEELILRCMAKKPADRPSNMQAIEEALEAALEAELAEPAGPPRRRRGLLVASIAGLAVAAVAAGAVVIFRDKPKPPAPAPAPASAVAPEPAPAPAPAAEPVAAPAAAPVPDAAPAAAPAPAPAKARPKPIAKKPAPSPAPSPEGKSKAAPRLDKTGVMNPFGN